MANLTIGKGRIYFDVYDANGNVTGERYLGNTPGFTFGMDTEVLEHYDADFSTVDKDDEAEVRTNRKFSLTTDEISLENTAIFVKGGMAALTQAAGNVSDEAIADVLQGRFYQLGVSAGNPTGVRAIGSVVVTDDNVAPVTFAEGADYTVDLDLARLYIVPGGAIANGANLEVDYAKTAVSRDQINTGLTSGVQGALRYIADNKRGANRDIYAPKVTLKPSGEMQLKGGGQNPQWAEMAFDVEILSPGDGRAALYIDGRAA